MRPRNAWLRSVQLASCFRIEALDVDECALVSCNVTKTLSMYKPYFSPRVPWCSGRSCGPLDSCGLGPLIEESPRLRFESARDYPYFEAVPRWGSMVILWPCGGHDAGSNLALGLCFSLLRRKRAFF